MDSGLSAGELFNDTMMSQYFRRVVVTEKQMQVVMMSLNPGEIIPAEIHDGEQLFVILVGKITAKNVDTGDIKMAGPGEYVMIRAGTHHEVKADDTIVTKLFTVYSPPQHAFNTIQVSNAE
jgi:quercetin dioxygenase-like cupin family protein